MIKRFNDKTLQRLADSSIRSELLPAIPTPSGGSGQEPLRGVGGSIPLKRNCQPNDAKTHLAEIIYNKSIGKDCFRMDLEIASSLGVISPGQFIHLKLTPDFEPLLRRPFSIFNVFKTGKNKPCVIEIAYQVVGKGTRLMAQMKPGTKVDLLGPLGNGFRINSSAVRVPPVRDELSLTGSRKGQPTIPTPSGGSGQEPLRGVVGSNSPPTGRPFKDATLKLPDYKKANISILVGGGLGTAALHLLLKLLIESGLSKGNSKIYTLVGARSKEGLYLVDSFRRLEPNTMIATEDGSKGTKGLVTDLLTKLIVRLLDRRELQPTIPTPSGGSVMPTADPPWRRQEPLRGVVGSIPLKRNCQTINKLDLSAEAQAGIRHSSLDIQIYACGPKGMTKAISHIAALNKINCQVSLEEWMGCGIGICRACVCKIKQGKSFRYATTCAEGPVFDSSQLYLEKS